MKSVVFRNDETGYTVLRVSLRRRAGFTLSREPEATVVGKCAIVWEGEELHAEGAWEEDAVHGSQFRATSITCVVPHSVEGVRRYLSSGLIKGIGRVNAGRIVDHFGEKTLEILEKQCGRLVEVPKIGPKLAAQIAKTWREQRGIREVMIFTQTYGISVAQTTKIYRRYGADTIAMIKADPYRPPCTTPSSPRPKRAATAGRRTWTCFCTRRTRSASPPRCSPPRSMRSPPPAGFACGPGACTRQGSSAPSAPPPARSSR